MRIIGKVDYINFWMEVYTASIRGGSSPFNAQEKADDAVRHLEESTKKVLEKRKEVWD